LNPPIVAGNRVQLVPYNQLSLWKVYRYCEPRLSNLIRYPVVIEIAEILMGEGQHQP